MFRPDARCFEISMRSLLTTMLPSNKFSPIFSKSILRYLLRNFVPCCLELVSLHMLLGENRVLEVIPNSLKGINHDMFIY
uniref:Uncharacterized protein n=1 Tax=Gossypium raimondii TaxID=29730 RepID=A0A0D2QMW1_GOSRA|nr:hypothetical protein B456_001G094200 [Gossypium raimondii]